MTAVAYGTCSSPRQRQQQPPPQQQHQHTSRRNSNHSLVNSSVVCHQTAIMYPTMPTKYSRQSSQPLTTPGHLHMYSGSAGGGGGNAGSAHKYNSPLPPSVSYMSAGGGGGVSQTHSIHPLGYGSSHRSHSTAGMSTTVSEMCRNYWSHPQHAATMIYRNGRHHSKRKSAVELLAETKPFYIKTEGVLERLQLSGYRGSNGKRERSGAEQREDLRCSSNYRDTGVLGSDGVERRYGSVGHALTQNSSRTGSNHMHHHHHHSHHPHVGGRHMGYGSSGGSSLLQNKLRMLLNNDNGTRERGGLVSTRSSDRYRSEKPRQFDFGGSCNKETSYVNDEESALRMAPTSFMSPEPYDGVYNYSGETSSGDEPLVLTENYRPISPPAEYAADTNQSNNEQRSRYNYQRSYSHSHEVAADSAAAAAAYNINSHKSLPDLHAQTSRHSPHSEILSCCSRGNRSIKSAGESSLNRDSGGSSGHYTHRSEPCYRQQQQQPPPMQSGDNGGRDTGGYGYKMCCSTNTPMEYRRDSGSSTQHSANSYCGYASPSYPTRSAAECIECHCKTAPHLDQSDFLFNFPTPEVPEAFQDDYTPPSPSVSKYKPPDEPRYSNSSSQQLLSAQVIYSPGGMKHTSQGSMVQSPGSAPSVEDISPPPIQFKRQKCIRFKNRSRISLPSVSAATAAMHNSVANEPLDIGYQKSEPPQAFVFPKCFSADGYPTQEKLQPHSFNDMNVCGNVTAYSLSDLDDRTRDFDDLHDLEKFFDRLGLNDEKFHEIYSNPRRRRSSGGGGATGGSNSDSSSTVFFSDVSTVDSMRLPDSTETQSQTSQPYRPSEPPSIVERNARIIKWLCNCRKLQYTRKSGDLRSNASIDEQQQQEQQQLNCQTSHSNLQLKCMASVLTAPRQHQLHCKTIIQCLNLDLKLNEQNPQIKYE